MASWTRSAQPDEQTDGRVTIDAPNRNAARQEERNHAQRHQAPAERTTLPAGSRSDGTTTVAKPRTRSGPTVAVPAPTLGARPSLGWRRARRLRRRSQRPHRDVLR